MRSKILLVAGIGVLTAIASGAAYKSITGQCPLAALIHAICPSCSEHCPAAPSKEAAVSCSNTSCRASCTDVAAQAPKKSPAQEAEEALATSQPAK